MKDVSDWPLCPSCGAMALTCARGLKPDSIKRITVKVGDRDQEIIVSGEIDHLSYTCPQWHYWKVIVE